MVLIWAILILTAILMIAAPEACTRKSDRGNEQAVKKTRTLGMWLFFAAVIWMITAKLA